MGLSRYRFLSRSFSSLARLPSTPKLSATSRGVNPIPKPAPIAPMQASESQFSNTPVTQDEFLQLYDKWGRGTKEDFVVYSFLTENKRMVEWQDFTFIPQAMYNVVSTFTVGNLVWRIRNQQIFEPDARLKLQAMNYENQGRTVIDFTPSNLQPVMANSILEAALLGQAPLDLSGGF